MVVRVKGLDGRMYLASDRDCRYRPCFAPGEYQHRAPLARGGSQSTGGITLTCMHNAYHGCPDPKPEPGRVR